MDQILSDATAKAIVKQLKLTRKRVAEILGSVASIKVSAKKPQASSLFLTFLRCQLTLNQDVTNEPNNSYPPNFGHHRRSFFSSIFLEHAKQQCES